MDTKTKFIIIGLSVLVVIFLLFILQLNSINQNLQRKNRELEADSQALYKQNEALGAEVRRLQDKNNVLQRELSDLQAEKEALKEFKDKYKLVLEEKEELIEKIKELTKKLKSVSVRPAQPQEQKIPAESADSYWAGILKANKDLEFQIKNLQEQLSNLKLNNQELQTEKKNLELKVSALGRDNEELKNQLEYNQKLMDSLAQEIVRERNDKAKVQEFLKSIKIENDTLRRQLVTLNSQKVNLEKKIVDLQNQNSALSDKIKQMDVFLQERSTQIDKLQQKLSIVSLSSQDSQVPSSTSVELPPIVVKAASETKDVFLESKTSVLNKEGKILAINREYNFVIIDLGENDQVKPGDTFEVFREDKSIGKIKVTQVRKNISACDIVKELSTFNIGDKLK